MSYSKTPPMPVVNGEVTYEWHKNQSRHDLQRFMFWTCMLNGAAEHTYGAGGIWQMNTEEVHGSDAYETVPWYVAMHYIAHSCSIRHGENDLTLALFKALPGTGQCRFMNTSPRNCLPRGIGCWSWIG